MFKHCSRTFKPGPKQVSHLRLLAEITIPFSAVAVMYLTAYLMPRDQFHPLIALAYHLHFCGYLHRPGKGCSSPLSLQNDFIHCTYPIPGMLGHGLRVWMVLIDLSFDSLAYGTSLMTSEELFPKKRGCLLGLLVMACYTAVVFYFSKSVSEVLQWCILPMIFLFFMGMLEPKPPPRLHDSSPNDKPDEKAEAGEQGG